MCIYSDCVLLEGDLNIHDENLNDGCAKEFLNILDNLRISLHVTKSKHNKGHILDEIFSKGLNILEAVVADIALSDHCFVLFKKVTSANLSKGEAEIIREHYINNTCALFTHHHQLCLHLLSMTLNVVPTVIDSIAPIFRPTFSDKTTGIKAQIRLCRQAESRWQKQRFQVY